MIEEFPPIVRIVCCLFMLMSSFRQLVGLEPSEPWATFAPTDQPRFDEVAG